MFEIIETVRHPDCHDTPYEEYCEAVKMGNMKNAPNAAERELLFLRKVY